MTTNKTIRKWGTFRLSEDLFNCLKEEARKANKSLNKSILTDAMLKSSEGNSVLKKNDTEV